MASGAQRRQRRMGPAPFASFEDLSDEVRTDNSPERLPGINEDVKSLVPSAPRIDISRASSSSHHEDSRDSTPERELFQTPGQRLGLAFREEGALELRSSTEELDFQDPTEPRKEVTISTVTDVPLHQRKDSQGSEYGGLLSISGRTSRLSSIGSQGSRVSGVSGASRLSVTSGMSRSPSPHKMLLETSFCGSKSDAEQSGKTASNSNKIVETELLERVLLSRKHDPTEAILAEGISIECRRKIQPADSLVQLADIPAAAASPVSAPKSVTIPPEKPARKSLPPKVSTDVIITVNKPSDEIEVIHNDTRSSPLPGKLIADSGIEYTFIPLKGPLPKEKKSISKSVSPTRRTNVNSAPLKSSDPHYIRIKLKPDHMYPGEPSESHTKPASLDLSDLSNGAAAAICKNTPSPSISRKSSFASLFRGKDYGTSPESPTIPASTMRRKSRSRSKSSDRDRTSDANDRQSKHRSVFTLFKSKKAFSKSKQSLTTEMSPGRHTTVSLHSLEFTFDQPTKKYYEIPLDSDTIIIPLHSPGNEPPPLPLFADEPSTETVVNTNRQSSTSSENVVFSTNLGSDNEIFTTKLPKRKNEGESSVENQNKSTASIAEDSPVQNGLFKIADCEEQLPEVNLFENNVKEAIENAPEVNFFENVKGADGNLFENNVKKTDENLPNLFENSIKGADGNNSSESDSEVLPKVANKHETESEHERKGLMLQQDSFDDEFPYIPTTLPLERSVAIPIVPIKQRASFEIRTCPIERPRSTTPINPSYLEDYCEDVITTATTEKLRISLPREDSIKSPRRLTAQESAPPLPPRGAPKDWINFEEIPERRKPPKRIQTIPSRGTLHAPTTSEESNVIYSYVNPEDCKCECHESSSRANPTIAEKREEDELPLLLSADRRSDSSPESQAPTVKKTARSNKPTNAFPHVATTSS